MTALMYGSHRYDEAVRWSRSLFDPLRKPFEIDSQSGIIRITSVRNPIRIVIRAKWPLGTRAHSAFSYTGQYDRSVELSSEHQELREVDSGLGFLFSNPDGEEEAACTIAVSGIECR
jgi:hypothetical protein